MTGEPDPHRSPLRAAPPDDDPPWLRDAFAVIAHEIAGWLRALWAVARAPRRFVADWADGKTRPLNPLAFALNGLTLAGPVTALVVYLVHLPDDDMPLWLRVLKPLVPWIYNIVWLLPVHLFLRLAGGKRKLRTTIGASFYAGGPMHILRLLVLPFQLLQMQHPHDLRLTIVLPFMSLLLLGLVCFYLASAMAGAHRLAMWRATLVIVSFMALSIVGWSYFGLKTGVAGMRVVRLFIT